jgi:hypothetical protein
MIFFTNEIFQVTDSEINFFEVYDSVKEVFCAIFEFKNINRRVGKKLGYEHAGKNVGVYLK